MSSVDKSKTSYTSPDVRITRKQNSFDRTPDPFWPELAIDFGATPGEIMDWATLIWEASEFLNLFDEEQL